MSGRSRSQESTHSHPSLEGTAVSKYRKLTTEGEWKIRGEENKEIYQHLPIFQAISLPFALTKMVKS
ncbi:MAG: hypothetical protein AB4080_12415 [Trichodesmium sp.]